MAFNIDPPGAVQVQTGSAPVFPVGQRFIMPPRAAMPPMVPPQLAAAAFQHGIPTPRFQVPPAQQPMTSNPGGPMLPANPVLERQLQLQIAPLVAALLARMR